MITLKFILDTTKKSANIELLCSFVIGTNQQSKEYLTSHF